MNFGRVIKRNENDFLVFANESDLYVGYNVVPKYIDPYNLYDIADVRSYIQQNPEAIIDQSKIDDLKNKQKLRLQLYLYNQKLKEVTDQLMSLRIDVSFASVPLSDCEQLIKDLMQKRKDLQTSIEEISNNLNS